MADYIIDNTKLNTTRSGSRLSNQSYTPREVISTDRDFIIQEDCSENSSNDDEKLEKERKAQEKLRADNAKGVMFIVFSTFVGTLQLLTTKLFFTNLERNQKVDPLMLIFIKSCIGLVMMLLIANNSLKKRMEINKPDMPYFIGRVVMMAATIGLSIYASKYIRVVYIGFTGNITPLLTAALSVIILGEKIKVHIKYIFLLAFIGGFFISYGIYYKFQHLLKSNRDAVIPIPAYIAVISVPFMSACGNIMMRKMKKTHWMTLNLYSNIFNIAFCMVVISIWIGYSGFN